MEQEFEILLDHLGRDVGYVGHRVQKDVQKCLNDLKATHNSKKFCSKLADILKKFSEYTIQYSKDLESRIKDYNKEEEYSDITKRLQEISCAKVVTCNRCKNRERGAETSNSLGPPNNNIEDESTELPKNELKNEVVSQCSLHIDGNDEMKSEQLTQSQASLDQNEDEPINIKEQTSQQLPDCLSYNATNPSYDDHAITDSQDTDDIFEEGQNCDAGTLHDDTDIANSLEISHSEEIQANEDQEEVIDCLPDQRDIPDKSQTAHSVDLDANTVENPILKLDNDNRSHSSDKLQKTDIIALPYKSLEKEETAMEPAGSDSNAETVSVAGDGDNFLNLDQSDISDDSNKLRKIDAIPLPYKPLFEKEKPVLEPATLNCNEETISVSQDGENHSLDSHKVAKTLDFCELKKIDVIPLPYKPVFEKTETVQKSDCSDVARATAEHNSVLEDAEKTSNLKDDTSTVKITTPSRDDKSSDDLASGLPEKNDVVQIDEDDDSDVEIVPVASPHKDDDIEISDIDENNVINLLEEDDSDVEIIEDIYSPVETNSDQESVLEQASKAEVQNADESSEFDAETVKNGSSQEICPLTKLLETDSGERVRETQKSKESINSDSETVENNFSSSEGTVINSAEIAESQNTDGSIDSDSETVKNNSSSTKGIIINSANIAESQKTEGCIDSDIETVENDSGSFDENPVTKSDQKEKITEALSRIIITEETVNTPPRKGNAESGRSGNLDQSKVDCDAATDANISPRQTNVSTLTSRSTDNESLPNLPRAPNKIIGLQSSNEVTGEESPLAVPLQDDDEVVVSEGIYLKQTVSNCSPMSENNSDETIIVSPVDVRALNPKESGESEDAQSKAIQKKSVPKMTEHSDTDDDIYSKTTQKSSAAANDKNEIDSDVDFDAPTQVVLRPESSISNSREDNFDHAKTQDTDTIDNDDLIGLTGNKAADTVRESPERDEEQDDVATQDIEIPQNQVLPEGKDVTEESDSQESYVFNLETEQNSEEVVQEKSPENNNLGDDNKEKGDGDMNSQESFVSDLENEEHQNPEDSSTSPVEDSEAPPNAKNDNEARSNDIEDGDGVPISDVESGTSTCGSSHIETNVKEKKKLKDKDRKSLLKVIAEYFLKKKREKATEKNKGENENENLKKKERDKKRPGKSKVIKENKQQKLENRVKTKREKKKTSSKKGEKYAKEYIDFLNAPCIDEASNSSVESVRGSESIQEDISGLSDGEATQIENFESSSNQDISTNQKINNRDSDKVDDTQSKTVIEDKTDNEDSEDSRELFRSSKKVVANKPHETGVPPATPEEGIQSFSDFVNKLPLKSTELGSNKDKDSENSNDSFENDPDMTQKVDDLRKLRQSSKKNVNDVTFDQPTHQVGEQTSKEPSEDDETQDVEVYREEIEDELVVSPFKRKVVRPLPSTLSDGEDIVNRDSSDSQKTDEDSQVVSPFKKKGVKRLLSSDESDSEPHKKTLEAKGSQESDVFNNATQELVPLFKRTSVKRLLSSDESEISQNESENAESNLELGLKRRKVQRLLSSEQSSLEGLDTDQSKGEQLDKDQNDSEKGQEMSEETHIEPSQFRLDDKARDDFLEMFDEPIKDNDSSDKNSVHEENIEADRDANSDIADENVEVNQFRLGDCDRDNLLNLLTDKKNDELIEEEKSENSRLNLKNKDENKLLGLLNEINDESSSSNVKTKTATDKASKEDNRNKEVDKTLKKPSQFKLNSKARDEFLNLLSSEQSSDSRDDGEQYLIVKKDEESDSSGRASNKSSKLKSIDADIQPSQFKLNSADRDELLEMLSEQGSDSRAEGREEEKNINKKEIVRSNKKDRHKTKTCSVENEINSVDELKDEEIEPSQFKLNDKARDDFLDMFSSDHTDSSQGGNESGVLRHTDKSKEPEEEKNSKKNDHENIKNKDESIVVDKVGDERVDDQDDADNTVTENSQGIDDFVDDSDADVADDTLMAVDEILEESEGEEDKQINGSKPSEFKLDEKEKDELLNLLSEHIKKTKRGDTSDSSDSDSDVGSDEDSKKGKSKEKGKKKVDKDMLLELLQEYEKAVKDKGFVENFKNGDMEVDNMDSDIDIAEREASEDSGADSDSVLLDVLREETIDLSVYGQRKRSRNGNKEAWNAYQQLLEDNEDLSDTSSEISNIDIDDLELDFSDQERKKKERILQDKLRKEFGIKRELVVNLEQTDISEFDLSSLPQKGGKYSSNIDRLCDISNVLQKRKRPERKRRKVKLARLSPSIKSALSGSSSSDDEFLSSSSSHWSDHSPRTQQDSASNTDSPFHLSDDNAEQDKLANALWDNIKNSSDENSGWSSDSEDASSDDDEDKKKKKKKNGGGGDGKKKDKKVESDSKEEDDSGNNTDSDKSSEDEASDKNESGDEEKKDKEIKKEADLDSSDEEDFVGVRKERGAWRRDPLLKGCLTSDEESDSDAAGDRKKRSRNKIRKQLKRKLLDSNDVEDKSDSEANGTKMITTEIDSSDSDVEFVMEKKKTPNKPIEIDEEGEEDSPSKRGKGRRNIRALFEDDELAEATRKAKKDETERIKRLQEREKAKETYTQSQSFGSSQLSEDESEPLILDVNEELQIKVHPKITKKLKPHQRDGIQFMWDSCYESVEQLKKGYEGSGCILAHCMGLGKTLQALGLIHTVFNFKEVTKTKHVLVVCPLSTVSNWRNEYKLAYKDIRHCRMQLYTIQDKKEAGNRFKIVQSWWKSGGILVMGYECFGIMINDQKLDKWTQQNLCKKEDVLKALVSPGPDLVICDEGHLLRNKQTQRNLALNKVETRKRIVLTGTPLQNNLLEYYYMVHFVKPNLLGTEREYKTNFVNPISNGQFEDSTAIDILFMKKRTHVLHKILNKTVQRVEDTELKRYLPELVDQALFVRLSDLQVKFYNTYLDGANARPVEFTASGSISRKNFLADIQVLRYICTHPDVVTIAKRSVKSKIKEQDVIDDNMDEAIDDKVFSKGEWYKELIPESGVKNPEVGTKMMLALGIVEEAVANNDKVLIFSQTHAEMDSLEFFLQKQLKYKKGVDYHRMDGTISPEVRTHMCDNFNSKHNKRLKVFIMSTKVGGLGLNLTAANRVILMNVNWNPSSDTQSVFRAFRFGQDKAVFVYRLIAIDTMEEKMYQRQVTKLAVAHRVVDKHQITRHYSAADIQEFYSVRPTIEGERPVPNVPEDRILAKLIQKHQFLYKWHEHQALLANRPEEDLNEQQKNAAWEEFNRKAVDLPPPGIPPLPNQFMNISNLLNQPGPSGMQNRVMPPNPKPRTNVRRSRRIKNNQTPHPPPHVPLPPGPAYVVPGMLPLLFKQTPSGPRLVFQSHGRILRNRIPGDRPSMTVSVVDTATGVESGHVDVSRERDDEAARKIQEINSLVSAQTTPELISGFNEGGLFADHNYSLPKTNPLNFRTSSLDDFNPVPFPKFQKIPCPLFVDVGAPIAPPFFVNKHKNNYKMYRRPTVTQRTNSADDFRTTQSNYVPRPLFVDVRAPLGPRPNLGGPVPSQKVRSSTANKPVQNQQASSSPTQVRLGSGITITTQNNSKATPPPAHAQKPSVSIIPQPAFSKAISNSTTTTKPPPFVPRSTKVVQNPLNLAKGVQSSVSPNQPGKAGMWIQKEKTPIRNVIGNSLVKGKQTPISPRIHKSPQNITLPPKKVVFSPPKVTVAAPKVHLTKTGATLLIRPVSTASLLAPVVTSASHVNGATTNVASANIATASSTTTSAQQSSLQKQMRNFMEHLHLLQATMKEREGGGVASMGDSNTGRVWNPTVNNQETPNNINAGRTNNINSPLTVNSTLTTALNPINSIPPRTVVRVGPRPLSPTKSATNFTGLNAARDLSNIRKTYHRAKNNKVSGVMPPLTIPSTSQSAAPTVRVIGTFPTSIPGSTTVTTSRVVVPNNTRSNVPHTNPNSPGVARKVITNNPKGAPRNTVINTVGQAKNALINPIGQPNGASKNTVINPIGQPNGSRNTVINPIGQANGVTRNSVINPVVQNNNGGVPRVITRGTGPKNAERKAKVNPVRLLKGNGAINAVSPSVGGVARMVTVGGNGTARIVPVSPGTKKKEDGRQNVGPVQKLTSPIRLDLLKKNMIANLRRSPKKLPPRQLPSAPQRSFHNGANVKTYDARKNNSPSRTNSLPSLSLSQNGISISKSNKENRAKRKLSLRTNNTGSPNLMSSIDLSNDEDGANDSSLSVTQDVVNTLKKKGVSINFLKKDVINLD